MKQLFIGIEETNIAEFVSPCCGVGLSLEPLCHIVCGQCGKTVASRKAVHHPPKRKNPRAL